MTLNPVTLFNRFLAWFADKLSYKAKVIIAVAALLFVVAMGAVAYKINDYFEHNPNACFACHVHDEANKQWARSEHAGINCHACHEASKKDQVVQMYRFAFLGQRSVSPRHGEVIVPRTLCLRCHWERDEKFPNAPDISRSRYHAKHVFNEKIECTKCHGYRTHKFTMEERYCLTCHKDKEFRPHGTTDQPGKKVAMGDFPCLNCHTDRTRDLRPGRMKCLFCHGGEDVRKQLIADGTLDVTHFMPSQETIGKAIKINIPENAAMKFDCSTCHNPHLRARPDWATCTVKCHQNVPYTGKHEIHLQMNLTCKGCHKPHLWKVTPEFAKKECVTCHEYKDPKLFLK
jgi:nitrate reductase cytochrome c-type subunit